MKLGDWLFMGNQIIFLWTNHRYHVPFSSVFSGSLLQLRNALLGGPMEHENFQHLESVLTEDDTFSLPGLTNNRLNNGRKGYGGHFQSYNVRGKREGQAKGLIKPERVHQRVLVLTQKEARILYVTSSIPTSRSSPSLTPPRPNTLSPQPLGACWQVLPRVGTA